MGSCDSKLEEDRNVAVQLRQQQISQDTARVDLKKSDKQIEHHMKVSNAETSIIRKYLLLGTGSAGKSTLFRQLKCICGGGLEEKDIAIANRAIRVNCVLAILLLLRKSLDLYELDAVRHEPCKIDLDAMPHLLPLIQIVLNFQPDTIQKFPLRHADEGWLEQLGRAIACLWALPQIQETYKRREFFCIAANMDFFLSKATKVFHPSFRSSYEDFVRSRITTTSISDALYTIEGIPFHVFDAGGQRSERQKWIHLFEGISAVIFVAALDHFCSMLFEDESKNALEESLDLFEEIVNSKWFRRTHIILYLNKMDLFNERIRSGKSLRLFFNAESYRPKNPRYFDEYRGPDFVPTGDAEADEKRLDEVVEAATDFILEQFVIRNHYTERPFSVHKSLSATDGAQVKKAFWDALVSITPQDDALDEMF